MGSSRQSSPPIQGSRPASLKVKDSGGMFRKPAVPPPTQRRSPLIIYVKSPKIIHTKPCDFMALVQRLTGKSPTPPPPSSPSPARRTSSSVAPDMTAMPQAPSSACFASLDLDGTTSTNHGIPQEMPLIGDDIAIDAKPYQMLDPSAVLCAASPADQNLHYFPSSTTAYSNLVEISSSPMIVSAPYSQGITPFLSAVSMQGPWASMPLINQTSAASSSFDIDFTSRTDLYSL